jgi:transposase
MVVFDLATRALIIAYKADGKTNQEITEMTGVEKRTINSIYARAIERGFDPAIRKPHVGSQSRYLFSHASRQGPEGGQTQARAH